METDTIKSLNVIYIFKSKHTKRTYPLLRFIGACETAALFNDFIDLVAGHWLLFIHATHPVFF